MDGNRRWAERENISTRKGHEAGLETLLSCIGWCNEYGIEHLVVYAFSTENWNRNKTEVASLMALLEYMLVEKKQEFLGHGVRIRVIGETYRFSQKIQDLIQELEQQTSKHKKTVWMCLSYGGRAEIIEAARSISQEAAQEQFEQALWSADMPDLDLVIRTGGHHRLSNFLLWKAAYAELYFTKQLWPEFSKKSLKEALLWYEENIRVNNGK